MAHVYREVRKTVARDPEVADSYGVTTIARVVSFMGSIIMGILALRFILSLLGANRGNAFASFIYNVSHPFVAPFFGLFNYQEQIGMVRFEFETLIAIVFWGFVAWMIGRLLTIGTNDAEI